MGTFNFNISGSIWFDLDQSLLVVNIPWKHHINRPKYSDTVKTYLKSLQSIAQENANFDELKAVRNNQVSPITEQSNNPPIAVVEEQDEEHLQLVLTNALISSKFKKISLDNGQQSYRLIIELKDINIKDHHLMIPEIRLAKECVDLLSILHQRQKSGIISFLDKKLAALKRAHAEFKSSIKSIALSAEPRPEIDVLKPASVSFYQRHSKIQEFNAARLRENAEKLRNREFLDDIRATRLLRDMEIQTDLILEFQILRAWDLIKHHRISQGFVSSMLTVRIRTNENSLQEDLESIERECKEETQELYEIHEMDQDNAFLEYQVALAEWKAKNPFVENVPEEAEEIGVSQLALVNEVLNDQFETSPLTGNMTEKEKLIERIKNASGVAPKVFKASEEQLQQSEEVESPKKTKSKDRKKLKKKKTHRNQMPEYSRETFDGDKIFHEVEAVF